MTLEIKYICDTCRSTVTKDFAIAVIFNAEGTDFTLWEASTQAFHDHKGVHVCKACLAQYRSIN